MTAYIKGLNKVSNYFLIDVTTKLHGVVQVLQHNCGKQHFDRPISACAQLLTGDQQSQGAWCSWWLLSICLNLPPTAHPVHDQQQAPDFLDGLYHDINFTKVVKQRGLRTCPKHPQQWLYDDFLLRHGSWQLAVS